MTHSRVPRRQAALACALLGTGCAPPDVDVDREQHHAPAAQLVAPQLARAGEGVTLDATGSEDADGDALGFTFDVGDGTPSVGSASGVINHIFGAVGSYAVVVAVEDESGLSATAAVEVVVVDGAVEDCSCDAPCLPPGLCTDDGCVVVGFSANAEGFPPSRLLPCP